MISGAARILIVDDSPLARLALRSALEEDAQLRVVGEAADGSEAIRLASQLHPDLVTLDLHMPQLGGLETIEALRRMGIARIVVVTAHPQVGGVDSVFAAISRGALDVLVKPSALSTKELEPFVQRVKELARAPILERDISPVTPARKVVQHRVVPAVVGIGASSGGPGTIAKLLRALPANFDLPIVIVQHIAEPFLESFVSWLRTDTSRAIRIAGAGDRLKKGEALIAPANQNMSVTSQGIIDLGPAEAGALHTPSVDCLFSSLATAYGDAAVGVLLTGMGADGAKGMAQIHQCGGVTIAQDRATSVVYGMPRAAVEAGAAQLVLPLHEISGALANLTVSTTSGGHPSRGQMNRKKILIVDDSPIVLEAARIALEEAGHEVVALDNPLQLAFVVRRTGPDLVLVDVNMPAITGDVVTEIMRSNPSASRTQIVLYSDISKDELSARAGRCGAAGFIQKQADEEMFVKEVERFLRD